MSLVPSSVKQSKGAELDDDGFRPITLKPRPLLGDRNGIMLDAISLPFELARLRNARFGHGISVASIAGLTRDGSLIFAATCHTDCGRKTLIGAFGADKRQIPVTTDHRKYLALYVPDADKPFAIAGKGKSALGIRTRSGDQSFGSYYDVAGESIIFDVALGLRAGDTSIRSRGSMSVNGKLGLAERMAAIEARNGSFKVGASWNRDKDLYDGYRVDVEASVTPRMTVTASWIKETKPKDFGFKPDVKPSFIDPSVFRIMVLYRF